MRNKKKKKIRILIILLLSVTIGYALISTTLKIDGTTVISKNTWSIYWDENSIKLKDGSKGSAPTVSLDSNEETTILNFSTTLDMPGDYYEFTVDAVNDGTIDAMIDGITPIEIPQELEDYISCTVMYVDRTTPANYHLLKKGVRVKYRVRVEFLDITREQFNNIPVDGLNCDFTYEVKYVQANNSAIPRPTFFGTATWDAIKAEYDAGDPDEILLYNMKEEALRSIDLDMNHDGTNDLVGHVRIANLSTPNECSNSNYSQTACGFVIEFADIIGTHRMNYYQEGGWASEIGIGTRGGWKYSDIRAYLNGGTYAYENINYENSSLLLSLPSDIRSKIIDTEVSSSSTYGYDATSIVTDKIYYLSPTELWGKNSGNIELNYDLNNNNTRQLDYYKKQMDIYGVSSDKKIFESTIKNSASPDFEWDPTKWPDFWGLREAYDYNSWDSSYFRVLKNGSLSATYSSIPYGISPAFRIAE